MDPITSFQALHARLLCVALQLLESAREAQDALRELLRRFATQAGVSAGCDAEAWLLAALSSACAQRLRAGVAHGTELRTYQDRPAHRCALLLRTRSLRGSGDNPLARHAGLERLAPHERAVYLLHRVFAYSRSDIAEALKLSERAIVETLQRAERQLENAEGGTLN